MPLVTVAILQVILLGHRCQVAPAALDLPLAHDARPLGTEVSSGDDSSLGVLADVLVTWLRYLCSCSFGGLSTRLDKSAKSKPFQMICPARVCSRVTVCKVFYCSCYLRSVFYVPKVLHATGLANQQGNCGAWLSIRLQRDADHEFDTQLLFAVEMT